MVGTEYEVDGYLEEEEAPAAQYSAQPTVEPVVGRNVVEQIALSAIQPKLQAAHIQNHHGAMQMYIANRRLARDSGLDEDEKMPITPFPCPSKTNTVTINDNGSGALVEVVKSMLSAIAPALKPQPEQSESPQSDKPATTQPPAADNFDLRVVPDGGSVPATPCPPKQSTWNKWGVPAALIASLASLGGSAYYYYQAPATPETPAVKSDVQGRIGVTIE